MGVAEINGVVHDAGLGRVAAVEERTARRIAEWVLAIGAFEAYAFGGELVDVGSLDAGDAVAAELGAEVVDHDEEDVESARICCSCRQCISEQHHDRGKRPRNHADRPIR